MADEDPIEPSTEASRAVCPRCIHENDPLASRCAHCGALFNVMLPFESASGEAWALGEAASSRQPSTAVLLGAWLLVAPTLIAFPIFVILGRLDRESWGPIWILVLQLAFPLAYGVLLGACLFLTTRNYVRSRRAHPIEPAA